MINFQEIELVIIDFFKKSRIIRSQIFYEKNSLKELLIDNDREISIKKILYDKNGIRVYRLTLNNYPESPEFIAFEKINEFFVIIGKEKRAIWEKFIRTITNMFPIDVGVSFLTSYEIKTLIEMCEKETKSKISYKKFVAKGVYGKYIDFTDVYYEKLKDKPFIEAYNKAQSKKGWIRTLEVYDTNGLFDFTINVKGQVTMNDGNLSFLFSHILKNQIEIIIQKKKFYEKRDRINTDNKPKTIIIKFDSDVFDDKKKILQFLGKIEEYPTCNYTIVEGGNPFLYVNILDRKDMSSFSIRTYKEGSLLILPKIKTTSFALQRFARYIVENFMEGEINEFE